MALSNRAKRKRIKDEWMNGHLTVLLIIPTSSKSGGKNNDVSKRCHKVHVNIFQVAGSELSSNPRTLLGPTSILEYESIKTLTSLYVSLDRNHKYVEINNADF